MDNHSDTAEENKEPSVLDYVKAKVMFWRGPAPVIPGQYETYSPDETQSYSPPEEDSNNELNTPIFTLVALGLAFIAQLSWVSSDQTATIGIFLYLLSFIAIFFAVQRKELKVADSKQPEVSQDDYRILSRPMLIGLIVALVAFVSFGGNRFSSFNIFLLLIALGFILKSLWKPSENKLPLLPRIKEFVQQKNWHIPISRWAVLWLVVFSLGIFFKAFHLGQVVPEMVSDHSEKLLDVFDVMQGESRIYFPRNTGREALQMYMIAGVAKLLGTGITFLSMKIGTVLAGIFMLPYIYLLGKEIGNRWVGLIAMFFAGIAYWPNILARVGLRFILYPAFVAPTLFYLTRGMRRARRNDFIWAGIFLGIGLHGYTPFRFVPVLIVIAIALYILHQRDKTSRRNAILWIAIVAFISLILFLPLLRFWIEEPTVFAYRAFSRVGTIERDFPGSIYGVFFSNLWNALKMVNWNSGNIWVVGVPHSPAVDLFTAAMFLLGVFLLLVRYLRKRNWQDLFLILAVPILMMPSILSLAFPDENPALNRAGGAMVIVFIIAALAFEAILRSIYERFGNRGGVQFATLIGGFFAIVSIGANYNMVFNTFQTQYTNTAWNTSEMGAVIAEFAHTVGDKDSAWVVAAPHWVDNRLVGINAGFPTKNYEIWPLQIIETVELPGPKLFLYKMEDTEAANTLRELYPNGANSLYQSEQENKSFYIFFVPNSGETP
ncbi:MAG: hypothetical protein HON98_01040 [Chloroflexi bacterium]|jgi:hypothetical protein|nr:hypothetical protein [Chloroflexota bacterium]MBT3668880.1 hypothetical protein [Chloroflexota bacterium]MBT4004249.1 hypothetical protein [Chloroflexota bacterium]MBT4306594.1 hypothetical protein [Chloroflexota bacterium]MBT4533978.1 hypothetical protein [Chloroflexota bacterium]